MRLLVVGGIGVDVNARLYDGTWPLPIGADKVFAQIDDLSVGHAGSGVSLQAAALGADVTVAAVIGDDEMGRYLAREFDKRGVALRIERDSSGTPRSVNLVQPNGKRLSLYDPRYTYESKPNPELWAAPLRNTSADKIDWLHAVVVNWARDALAPARGQGITVSTDLQDWDLANPHHFDFALGADYVFCSATNLPASQALPDLVFNDGVAQVVVITNGADGALIWTRELAAEQRNPIHIPAVAPPVDREIIDTTGAGDAFCGTFMTEIMKLPSPAERTNLVNLKTAGDKAALAAAYACSYFGTNNNLLTAELLDDLIPDGI